MKRSLLIAALLLCCGRVWAETLYVQPGQYITIQSAINDANDTDTISTGMQTLADLEITKSDNPDPVTAGQTLNYTLTMKGRIMGRRLVFL